MARHYSDWIAAYLKYTENTEAPRAFHWWTAISTIAGALQRKVYIDMYSFEWVPNFFIILVGQAGLVTKSTSLRLGEHLLRNVGKKIRFGSASGSWQAMAEEISKAALNSAAFKMDGSGTGFTTCPISYFVSELGTFLEPTNREQIDFFVDAWDGQRTTWTRTTKSGGSLEIKCPCVNILAATTPTWIKENFNATMIGGGFCSRVIFVRGSAKQKLIAYPAFEAYSSEFEERKGKLIEDLKHISNLEGPFRMTQDAVDWGRQWYEDHFTKKRQLTGERFDGFYARKQTHLHKLAMILAVSEDDRLVIDVRHLKQAHDFLLAVEVDLASVVENVTSKQISAMHKRELLSIIGQEGRITQPKLYEQVFAMMSGPDYEKALADLSKANQISIQPSKGEVWLSLKRPMLRVVENKEVKEG